MDGERSDHPAGHEGGYVPPDLVSTQRFWAIPAGGRADAADAADDAQRGSAESVDRRVAPAENVIDALATQPGANGAMPDPMAAAAPPRLPARGSAAPMPWPPSAVAAARASTSAADHGTSSPGSTRKSRPSRNLMGAAVAAAGVVIIGAGVAALWPGDGASPVASGDGTSSASAPAKTQRGAASPTGNVSAGSAGAPAGARPLTRGRVVSYETTQREPGYFEGLLTLTNRTGKPLDGWQVSFTYPGASVKSVWGGVLVRAGGTATIRGADAAGSLPPGVTVQVRFGAAGTPSAPVGCTLNGGPC